MTAKEKFIEALREHGVNEDFISSLDDKSVEWNSIVVESASTQHITRFFYARDERLYRMTDTKQTWSDIWGDEDFRRALFDPYDANETPDIWGGDPELLKQLYDWFASEECGKFPLDLQALDCTQFMNNFDHVSVDVVYKDDEDESDALASFKQDETYHTMIGGRQSALQVIREAEAVWKKTLVEEIKNEWSAGLNFKAKEMYLATKDDKGNVSGYTCTNVRLHALDENSDRDKDCYIECDLGGRKDVSFTLVRVMLDSLMEILEKMDC